jgi:hypothetical protein
LVLSSSGGSWPEAYDPSVIGAPVDGDRTTSWLRHHGLYPGAELINPWRARQVSLWERRHRRRGSGSIAGTPGRTPRRRRSRWVAPRPGNHSHPRRASRQRGRSGHGGRLRRRAELEVLLARWAGACPVCQRPVPGGSAERDDHTLRPDRVPLGGCERVGPRLPSTKAATSTCGPAGSDIDRTLCQRLLQQAQPVVGTAAPAPHGYLDSAESTAVCVSVLGRPRPESAGQPTRGNVRWPAGRTAPVPGGPGRAGRRSGSGGGP